MSNSSYYHSEPDHLPTEHCLVYSFVHDSRPSLGYDHSTEEKGKTDSEKSSRDIEIEKEIQNNPTEYVRNLTKDFYTLQGNYCSLLPVLGNDVYTMIESFNQGLEKELQSKSANLLKLEEYIIFIDSFFEIFLSYHREVKPIENAVIIMRKIWENRFKYNNSDFIDSLELKLTKEGEKIESFLRSTHNKIKKQTEDCINLKFELFDSFELDDWPKNNKNDKQQYNTQLYNSLSDMQVIIRKIEAQQTLYSALKDPLVNLLENANKIGIIQWLSDTSQIDDSTSPSPMVAQLLELQIQCESADPNSLKACVEDIDSLFNNFLFCYHDENDEGQYNTELHSELRDIKTIFMTIKERMVQELKGSNPTLKESLITLEENVSKISKLLEKVLPQEVFHNDLPQYQLVRSSN